MGIGSGRYGSTFTTGETYASASANNKYASEGYEARPNTSPGHIGEVIYVYVGVPWTEEEKERRDTAAKQEYIERGTGQWAPGEAGKTAYTKAYEENIGTRPSSEQLFLGTDPGINRQIRDTGNSDRTAADQREQELAGIRSTPPGGADLFAQHAEAARDYERKKLLDEAGGLNKREPLPWELPPGQAQRQDFKDDPTGFFTGMTEGAKKGATLIEERIRFGRTGQGQIDTLISAAEMGAQGVATTPLLPFMGVAIAKKWNEEPDRVGGDIMGGAGLAIEGVKEKPWETGLLLAAGAVAPKIVKARTSEKAAVSRPGRFASLEEKAAFAEYTRITGAGKGSTGTRGRIISTTEESPAYAQRQAALNTLAKKYGTPAAAMTAAGAGTARGGSPGQQAAYDTATKAAEKAPDIMSIREPHSPVKITTGGGKKAAIDFNKGLADELKAGGMEGIKQDRRGNIIRADEGAGSYNPQKAPETLIESDYFNKAKKEKALEHRKNLNFGTEEPGIFTLAEEPRRGAPKANLVQEQQKRYQAAINKGDELRKTFTGSTESFGSKGYRPNSQPKKPNIFSEAAERVKKGQGGSLPGLLVLPGYDTPNTRALFEGGLKRAAEPERAAKRRTATEERPLHTMAPLATAQDLGIKTEPATKLKPLRTAETSKGRTKAIPLIYTRTHTGTKTRAGSLHKLIQETATATGTKTGAQRKTKTIPDIMTGTGTKTNTRTKTTAETETRFKTDTLTRTLTRTQTKQKTKLQQKDRIPKILKAATKSRPAKESFTTYREAPIRQPSEFNSILGGQGRGKGKRKTGINKLFG